jgi:two-component system response regulator PilR (NtrC family)
VPPLRERRDDLPALCSALLSKIAADSGMPVPVLSPAVAAQLAVHPLAGNVRELENLLHRAVALSDGEALQVDYIPGAVAPAGAENAAPGGPDAVAATPLSNGAATAATAITATAEPYMPGDLQAYLDEREREILVRALQETGFNRTAAAQRLGLSLRQIRYRIARLAIAVPGGEEPNEA